MAWPSGRTVGLALGLAVGLALGLAVLLLGHTAASAWAAARDQTVVRATVYPSAPGRVTYPSVSLSGLAACPLYAGSSPMYLYPGGQPFQPAGASAWAMSTVLECGLHVPLASVTGVQLLNPSLGYEATLSQADLTNPSQFNDPSSAQALPVISSNGGEAQNTYVRPWRGGADDNAMDEVVLNGAPITVVVYENGSPLKVTASDQTVSRLAGTIRVKFSATVRGADGTAVPASSLTWAWSFGDGGTSTVPAPTHSFAAGTYFVTVEVTAARTGSGGTDTIQVSSPTSAGTGQNPPSGGNVPTGSKSPAGPQRSSGTHPGGPAGNGGIQPPGTSGRRPGAQAAPTHPGQRSRSSAAAGLPGRPPAAPHLGRRPGAVPAARHPGRGGPVPRRALTPARTTASLPVLVTGRLISDVTPLPAGSSPLVRDLHAALATAPPERRGIRASVLPGLGAALGVLVLLGLGAGREMRWRVRRLGT